MVCAGQLEYSRLCVNSLLLHSRRAGEVLIVDIASLDGTREFLQGVAIASPLNLRVFRVDEDWTHARAFALGASQSNGSSILFVNNDVIVTPGWIEQLTALADFEPTIGMVGAMSNAAPGQQYASPVPYQLKQQGIRNAHHGIYSDEIRTSLVEMDNFALRWREQHRTKWFEAETLATFCFLMKRVVFEKIGASLPECALGIDEVELSRSVKAAGYRIACCQDLFIHNSATRTPSRKFSTSRP